MTLLFEKDEFEKIEAREARYITVTYQVETEKLNKIKETTGASSASEVGKLAFEYYLENEC